MTLADILKNLIKDSEVIVAGVAGIVNPFRINAGEMTFKNAGNKSTLSEGSIPGNRSPPFMTAFTPKLFTA